MDFPVVFRDSLGWRLLRDIGLIAAGMLFLHRGKWKIVTGILAALMV